MSLRPAIPRQVALQHCPLPLHRPVPIFRPPEVFCQPAPSRKYKNWTRRTGQGKISTSGVGQIRVSKWARPEYRTEPTISRFRLSHRPDLQGPLAGGTILQVDQAAPPHQVFLWHQRERSEDPNLDRRLRLRAGRHRSQALGPGDQPLPNPTDFSASRFSRKRPFYRCSSHPTPRKIYSDPPIN